MMNDNYFITYSVRDILFVVLSAIILSYKL